MRAILAVALLLAATAALAEPSSSRLFQDGRGSGSSTSFTDRDGRFDGSDPQQRRHDQILRQEWALHRLGNQHDATPMTTRVETMAAFAKSWQNE
jgi:hypothetical protein